MSTGPTQDWPYRSVMDEGGDPGTLLFSADPRATDRLWKWGSQSLSTVMYSLENPQPPLVKVAFLSS